MRENASITFVRAVTPIHHDTGRLKGYGFAIVQPGGTPIDFQYATRNEAHAARRDLMKADQTSSVSPELFDVIARALNEAYTLGKHGNQSSDEI
jgi:hypothetical protein